MFELNNYYDDNRKIEIYRNPIANEFITLANLSDYYDFFPDYHYSNKNINTPPKDYLLQFYIGSMGVLGILMLYTYFEKS